MHGNDTGACGNAANTDNKWEKTHNRAPLDRDLHDRICGDVLVFKYEAAGSCGGKVSAKQCDLANPCVQYNRCCLIGSLCDSSNGQTCETVGARFEVALCILCDMCESTTTLCKAECVRHTASYVWFRICCRRRSSGSVSQ